MKCQCKTSNTRLFLDQTILKYITHCLPKKTKLKELEVKRKYT